MEDMRLMQEYVRLALKEYAKDHLYSESQNTECTLFDGLVCKMRWNDANLVSNLRFDSDACLHHYIRCPIAKLNRTYRNNQRQIYLAWDEKEPKDFLHKDIWDKCRLARHTIVMPTEGLAIAGNDKFTDNELLVLMSLMDQFDFPFYFK